MPSADVLLRWVAATGRTFVGAGLRMQVSLEPAWIEPGRRLEILPYFAGRAEYLRIPRDPDAGFANPFRSGSEYFGSAGVDLKYRLTSNFTLDATINPDFGQVEADPAVINLSAFETFFDERRPFFVEGTDVFAFGSTRTNSISNRPDFLYTRRIGRPPLSFFSVNTVEEVAARPSNPSCPSPRRRPGARTAPTTA